mmetsp:Transcript_20591/g.43818  ORF Transcript_20591/g.43818 Transcript_20591/m.43818 type:complete len:248 (-) Transcript_20591:92-835(-)|eukprot:CAMPEP_0180593590 /NCGR_PEP_ID=MMETSP1037_2-20121125/20329_1 /TAXON_ID=632150 /ORGANISM="Azadinium spinosum, Strain 3D9" /LENGTH=247 /DNA_ID=CAMNT_0022611975 /DNA_START=110 /DNA_END=853 /DNA_ORIENTATION=+
MKLAAVAVCVICLCAQALSIGTFPAPTEYENVGLGHCRDSSGKYYNSFENYDGNAKICEDSVKQCEEACSMFEYEQCRGFNYYTDYGGATNICSGKGRCELRMEVGFKEAKEGWKIQYQGGGGSGPIEKSDGDHQGTDSACYQRQPPPPPTITTTPPSVTAAPSPQFGSCDGQPRFDIIVCNSHMCTDCVLAWCTEACQKMQLLFPGCRCESWPEARKSFSGGEFAGKNKFGDVGDYSAGTGITPVS